MPLEITLTRSGFNTHAFFGAANTSVNFTDDGNNGGIQSITLQLNRLKFRPDIEANLEKIFKIPIPATYYKRICERSSTQPGTQSSFKHMKNFSREEDGTAKFVFIVIKDHAADTHQTNYQRMCHANVSRITVRYGAQQYPLLAQNADFPNNYFARFYKEFLNTANQLGYGNPALSMEEFRNLYTVFAVDISSSTKYFFYITLSVDVERREVPLAAAATLANPREIDAWIVIITEARIEIDCLNKVIRKK